MTASSLTAALLLAGNEGCLSVVYTLGLPTTENTLLTNRKPLKTLKTENLGTRMRAVLDTDADGTRTRSLETNRTTTVPLRWRPRCLAPQREHIYPERLLLALTPKQSMMTTRVTSISCSSHLHPSLCFNRALSTSIMGWYVQSRWCSKRETRR